MNYLAHAYLSFNQPDILAGNMISDFIKGKKKFDYPDPVQKGISLHRQIDSFTDSHAITSAAKKVFKSSVGLYAGAFVDVAYDHFLALDPQIFTPESLQRFSLAAYHSLDRFTAIMPEKFAAMFPYMKKHDWLCNYQFTWAIERSFGGIAARATYLSKENDAYRAFLDNYQFLQDCYTAFFPELQQHAAATFATLNM